MNELQEVEFQLLKVFIEFCNKHHLQYFLVEGTALGAVRHQGFIPWDDDLDVGLPREDYNRFIELAKKEFTGDIFLQTYETDPNYPYNFAKLRDSRTTLVEKVFRYCNMNHGVWIDIFPLDGISKKKKRITWAMKWRVLRTWPRMALCFPRCYTRKVRKRKWPLDILINAIMYPSYIWNYKHHMNHRIDRMMKKKKYEDCYYVANMQGAHFVNEIIKKEHFGKGVKATFEGIEVIIPEKYDEYLTFIYGDYMHPTPGEHCHVNAGMDLKTPYYEYQKDYKKEK